jgi:hypothetical protein
VEKVEHWYAEVEEESGRQWFDLQLGIVVNGERHSLLPIFLHLLRAQRCFSISQPRSAR